MAKRNKKDHKHWIPYRKRYRKISIGAIKKLEVSLAIADKRWLDRQKINLSKLDGRPLSTVERITQTDEVGRWPPERIDAHLRIAVGNKDIRFPISEYLNKEA